MPDDAGSVKTDNAADGQPEQCLGRKEEHDGIEVHQLHGVVQREADDGDDFGKSGECQSKGGRRGGRGGEVIALLKVNLLLLVVCGFVGRKSKAGFPVRATKL